MLGFIFILSFFYFAGSVWLDIRYSNVMSVMAGLFLSFLLSMYYFNGIDWLNYYYVFDVFKDAFEIRYDLFFNVYFYVMAKLFGNFNFTILIFYLLCFFFLYHSIKKSCMLINGPAFIYCIFFLSGLPLFIDQIRQFAAVCICSIAVNYLVKGDFKKSYKYIFAAALFHYSSLFLFIYRFIVDSSKKRIILLGVSLVTISYVIGSGLLVHLQIVEKIPIVGPELFRKVGIYAKQMDSFEVRIGFGIIADVLVISCYCFTKTLDKNKSRLWNILFISACFHMCFYYIPAFSRFNYFSNISYAILFASLFTKPMQMKINFQNLSLILAVLILSFIVTVKSIGDENRPAFKDYTLNYFFSNESGIEKLRSDRCFIVDSEMKNFCAK